MTDEDDMPVIRILIGVIFVIGFLFSLAVGLAT
jgi:hypothetical protein